MAAKLNNPIAPSRGFAPISEAGARVLILGSLPGQASLAAGQYYAQKQNAFWKIICSLTGASLKLDYEKRKQLLLKNWIALWDVCHSAERKGSMDSNIKIATLIPNDFESFLKEHRKISRIFFNGRFAEKTFKRLILPGLSVDIEKIQFMVLPSTSPAHAGMRFDGKLTHWKQVLIQN